MLDLALNAKTHDLALNGDVLFIDNVERVAQQIKIQLLTFLGEWFWTLRMAYLILIMCLSKIQTSR